MKVVIDTNVWVSALINPNGTPARIINHPAACDLLTSTAILTELERVLHNDRIQKRYQLTDEMFSAYLLTVRLDSELIEVTQQVNAVERIRRPTACWRARPSRGRVCCIGQSSPRGLGDLQRHTDSHPQRMSRRAWAI